MSLSAYIVDDNDDPVWSPDPSVSCALPDLRYALYIMLGAAVVVTALAVVAARKLRPW